MGDHDVGDAAGRISAAETEQRNAITTDGQFGRNAARVASTRSIGWAHASCLMEPVTATKA
ncbi:hypothetical protein ACBR40_04850 [Nonomuraea sp. AD125B]|uniref:hypothetical protein n=1 Tax=Nonomuraea sp. AD125B TaxID=3242897 RepID=UPI0035274C4C